jgi:phosphatidylserine/phosphatidylglycerophosphate/cardiolipin synthase-like enzyme
MKYILAFLLAFVPLISLGQTAPAVPGYSVGFSPDQKSEELVLRVINSSEKSIKLAAYSFTNPKVVAALVTAKKRGVDVTVLVDYKGNTGAASRSALNTLVTAGIPTRTISTYAIHHDKYIISDGLHVQNGSYNYSTAATKSNSENVLVTWNSPALAQAFLAHFNNRWAKGVDYKRPY